MAMTQPLTLADVDLADVDFFWKGDPHSAWRILRREDPVHWQERSWGPGIWHITKYEDVIRVGVDPATFISSNGIIMDNDGRQAERERAMQEGSTAGYMDARGTMMIMTDPPRHSLMRQLVNKGFTHKAVRKLEDYCRNAVRTELDAIAGAGGECDFVLDVARKLPLDVICELVGVPEGDWEAMFDLSNRVIGFDDPEFAREEQISAEEMQMSMDLFNYILELCQQRRDNPKDDVLTQLVHAEIDGQRLADQEIFLFFLLLIVAGNETTRNATSGGLLALVEHPDQWERLRADPSLVPTAVEEVLRWTSPVTHFTRFCTQDTEIRGREILAGQEVCVWYPSANRDEDVFANADGFDVGRNPNDHIAFGKGEHFCLGANLARLELRVTFEEIVSRFSDVELTAEPVKLRSNFIGGIKRMPVRFTSA
jgi:cytochrome P450